MRIPGILDRYATNNVFCTFGAMLVLAVSPYAAGFPLSTEDTSTLGQGHYKVELTGEWGETRESGLREVSVINELSLSHGLHDTLNGFVTLPYREVRTHASGIGDQIRGVGDVKFGIKWRYLEQGGLRFGVKAVMTMPTGNDAEKLGNGKPTQGINVITSYAVGSWEFNADLGYKRNGNTLNQRERLGSLSAAVIRSLDDGWKIMADIGVASSKSRHSDPAPAYFGAGLSLEMTRDMSLEAGLKRGMTSTETDFTG